MFQMVVLDSSHIFLNPCDVALQTNNIFSYSFGVMLLYSDSFAYNIVDQLGDNKAVCAAVNPVFFDSGSNVPKHS